LTAQQVEDAVSYLMTLRLMDTGSRSVPRAASSPLWAELMAALFLPGRRHRAARIRSRRSLKS